MQEFLINDFLPVSIMVVLIIALAAWLIRLVIFFTFRAVRWREPNPHENKETMGLPKGAVRTFLALSFTSLTALAILGGEDFVIAVDKKWLMGQLGIVIAFYFGSKAVESYVDSRVKLATIEKSTGIEEAMAVFREERPPRQGRRPVPGNPPVPPAPNP